MARYQHWVRKTIDAPAVRACLISTCFNGYYRINLVSHGYSVGDILFFSGFGLNLSVNGSHTVTNENLAANAFNIDVICPGAPAADNGFVTSPDISTYTQVYPLGFLVSNFEYEQPEGQIFFTRKLKGKLKFINQPSQSITDFNYFYNSELDSAGLVIDSCIGYQYLIKKECNGVFSDYYEAKFSLHDGEWDLDNCSFSIEPTPNTNYDCILNDIIVNIMDASPKVITLNERGSNPDRNYTNTIKFSVILEYLVSWTCDLIDGIVSDFFQINPETTSAVSYVTGETNPYTEMTIGASVDVREPIPSTLSTDVSLTFREFMAELNAIFNVYFTIENNFIRIEHFSYFDALTGMDLTQSKYDKFDTGKNKYTYLEVPRTESQVADRKTFLKVLYDNECSIEKRRDEKIVNGLISTRPGTTNEGDDNGLVLMATAYDAGLGKYVIIGSDNNTLYPTITFVKFHRHNLAQANGSLIISTSTEIYDDYLIYSSKKTKLQSEIKIPLCCEDDFESEDKVITDLGFGYIKSATFGIKDDTLKLQLKYGENNVDDITSPLQINGCDLWLDASVGVTSAAGQVSNWADQSGHGRDASQASGTQQPSISVVGSVDVISFDGNNDGLSTSAFQTFPSKRGSVFILFKCVTPTGTAVSRTDHIIGTYGNGTGQMWDIATSEDAILTSKQIVSQVAGGFMIVLADVKQSNTPNTFTYGYDDFILVSTIRISDTQIEGTGNGSLGVAVGIASGKDIITVPNTVPDVNPVNIGNSFIAGNSDPFYGYIAEILIYDHSLSDYNRQQVEQYFFKKYSVIKQYT